MLMYEDSDLPEAPKLEIYEETFGGLINVTAEWYKNNNEEKNNKDNIKSIFPKTPKAEIYEETFGGFKRCYENEKDVIKLT